MVFWRAEAPREGQVVRCVIEDPSTKPPITDLSLAEGRNFRNGLVARGTEIGGNHVHGHGWLHSVRTA